MPPDERRIAARLLLTADGLSGAERELCMRATHPGAPALHWRDKIRLAAAVGELLERGAPVP